MEKKQPSNWQKTRRNWHLLLLPLLLATGVNSLATEKAKGTGKAAAKRKKATPDPEPIKIAPLHWYLATTAGKPVGYFSETVFPNRKRGALITAQEWFHEGGAIGISKIETLTTDDDRLSPISFELHYVGKKSGKEFKISAIRKALPDRTDLHYKMIRIKPAVEREEKSFRLFREAIFYSSIPRYLARKETGMYVTKAIMEDVRSLEYSVKDLLIRRTSETKKFGEHSCERSFVDVGGATTDYWVAKDGLLCEISVVESGTTLSIKTEKEVKESFPAPMKPGQ